MEIYKNISLEDLPNEEWKYIPNCDNLYMVSSMGRIKALASVRKFGNTTRKHRERIIKQFPNWQGYLQCHISDLSQRKIKISSHKTVCDTFLPNPNNYPCVNHKNEIKWDNRVENLEHCSYSYNLTYGSREGLRDVSVLQYDLDGKYIRQYKSVKDAAKLLGIKRTGISNVLNGWSKTAGGYIWRLNNGNAPDEIEKYKNNGLTPVLCYDLSGNFVSEYKSIQIASIELNVHHQSISECCRGKNKRAGNYIFKYK